MLAFLEVRTLRSRAFLIDDLACERHALTAFGGPAEAFVRLTRSSGTGARGFPYLVFPNGIADADDHGDSLSLAPWYG